MADTNSDPTAIRLAYVEARLVRDDDAALAIARNNPAVFEWCGEMPDGWDNGTDWSEEDRHALVSADRIVWDEATYTYRRPAAAGLARSDLGDGS